MSTDVLLASTKKTPNDNSCEMLSRCTMGWIDGRLNVVAFVLVVVRSYVGFLVVVIIAAVVVF